MHKRELHGDGGDLTSSYSIFLPVGQKTILCPTLLSASKKCAVVRSTFEIFFRKEQYKAILNSAIDCAHENRA